MDMELLVSNKIEMLFKQYEKEVSPKRTVLRTSAMPENTKYQILSQDIVRGLLNTCESMGADIREQALDEYTQKLVNTGYTKEQTRRIVLTGIRGSKTKSFLPSLVQVND